MDDQKPESKPIRRREFVKVAGAASVAASTWWAITQKTDALAQTAAKNMTNSEFLGHNYEYEAP